MYFIAGLVVGSVIGFMFLFSWSASMSEEETEHYSQSSSSKDGDLADASVHEHHLQNSDRRAQGGCPELARECSALIPEAIGGPGA
jgi:hypothetical protein